MLWFVLIVGIAAMAMAIRGVVTWSALPDTESVNNMIRNNVFLLIIGAAVTGVAGVGLLS